MALEKKQIERLNKLDFAKGGGFSDFITYQQKLNPSDSKFLFIGLGGKGSKTVAGIKTEVYKRFNCDEDRKRPKNFEYLVIDTDKEAMEHLVKGGFGEVGLSGSPADLETCQLYDADAAKLLAPEMRHLIPEYISEWLSPTMNQELQGKGAGGVRQAGRYLLFGSQAFKTVQNALTQKLAKLNAQIVNSAKEKLIVYIFAGVSGGTGSGTIIDIPYIVRKICEDKGWAVKLYGYIFLPDTYSEDVDGDHLKYNAYAALKEIDTLMNIGYMGGSAHFRATYVPGFTVDSTERIFDSCMLVSGKKSSGGLVSKPDDFSRHVVVDNIVNLVADNQTSNGFLANSFLDNSPTEIQNKVVSLPKESNPQNAFYQYTVIGTGAMVMPLEQILAYMAHGSMDMMEKAWDKHAKQGDVEGFLGRLHMLAQELMNEIIGSSTVPLMQYYKGIGGPAKKQDIINDVLYNTLKQYWMTQNAALSNAWDVAKNKCLERIVNQFKEQYYSIFKDPDKGIYYLKELLSFRVIDNNTFNGVRYRLENEYLPSIQGFIDAQKDMQTQMDERMREIKKELDSPVCMRPGRLIEEYREVCVSRLVSDNMINLYDTYVKDIMNQVIAFVKGKIADLQQYIDIFTYMKDIVDNNYRMVMEGTMPQAEYAGKLMDFSDTTDSATQGVIQYLDNMLAGKNPEGLASALENSIIAEEEKWVHSEEDFNPMGVFVKFLEVQYAAIPNLTIEKFLGLKYGTGGIGLGLQSVCTELKNKAEVIFPSGPNLPLGSLASHRYVVIPAGAPNITKAMTSFAALYGATVARSVDMNSMYWYNLVIGVPLYALVDIGDYEKKYEENNKSGMHIRETRGDNWKDLPALTNQSLWPNVNYNVREKKYAEKVAENVKRFRDVGIITYDGTEELYYAYCPAENDDSVSEEQILKWCREVYLEEPETDGDGLIKAGSAFFGRLCGEKNFTKYLININTVYMEITDDDKEKVDKVKNLYQLVRMNIFLYRKMQDIYEIYKKCEDIITSSNASTLAVIKEKKNRNRFYDYTRCGIILLEEEAVILEKEDGNQDEIMYFDDHTRLENQFFVYYAFKKLFEMYQEEELEEFDQLVEARLSDKTPEAREKRKANADRLMKECSDAQESLKKAATKRELAEDGKANLADELTGFYNSMLKLQSGK